MEWRSIREWYIAMGFIPIALYFFAISIVMTGAAPDYFRALTIVALIAVIWLGVEWGIICAKAQLKHEFIGYIVVGMLVAIATWFAVQQAPILVSGLIPPGDYLPGANVEGIKWQKEFLPLDVSLLNQTDSDFADVRFYIRTNLVIAKIGFSGENDCRGFPALPGLEITSATMTRTDPQGHKITWRVLDNDQDTVASFFRVQCDKIRAHSQVDMALAAMRWPPGNSGEIRWVAVFAKYLGAYQNREQFSAMCLVNRCNKIPQNFDQMKQSAHIGAYGVVQ